MVLGLDDRFLTAAEQMSWCGGCILHMARHTATVTLWEPLWS